MAVFRELVAFSLADLALGNVPKFDSRTSATLLQSLDLAITRDRADFATRSILNRLDEKTSDWPLERRFELMSAVGAIARAEKARAAWKPKEVGNTYRDLAIEAMKSARLAKALGAAFDDPPMAIRSLIRQLLDFVLAALHESSTNESDSASYGAHLTLKRFRQEGATKSVSNVLLADLVGLALERQPGKRGEQFDESTIRRRYLKPRDMRSGTPASAIWRRGGNVLKGLSVLSESKAAPKSEAQVDDFRAAIRTRLQKPAR